MPVLRPRDILGTGIVLAFFGAVFIGLGFCPKVGFLPHWSYWDYTLVFGADYSERVPFGFVPQGHTVVGNLTVWTESWGGNRSVIYARLQDSQGNILMFSGLVNGSYNFVFEAPKDDTYYFFFNNTDSAVKCVYYQIFYYGNYSLLFQILASVFWTCGILCIGVSLLKEAEHRGGRREFPELAKEVIGKIIKGGR